MLRRESGFVIGPAPPTWKQPVLPPLMATWALAA
jgi:hypothetical protein